MSKVIAYANGLPIYDVETRAVAHDPATGQFTSSGGAIKGSGKSKKKADSHGYESETHANLAKATEHYLHKASGRDSDGVFRTQKHAASAATQTAHKAHSDALALSAKAHKSGAAADHAAAHKALGDAIKAHAHAAQGAHPDVVAHHKKFAAHAKEAQKTHEA